MIMSGGTDWMAAVVVAIPSFFFGKTQPSPFASKLSGPALGGSIMVVFYRVCTVF